MYLGGRGGEGAGGVTRAHTPLEQLLDEIKFQRRKELRSFSQVSPSFHSWVKEAVKLSDL
jgi:hypothetical protein